MIPTFLTVSLVTGKYLYLSDWVMRVIERVNIDFSSDREILLAGALDFVDLKAVTIKKKKSKHKKKRHSMESTILLLG